MGLQITQGDATVDVACVINAVADNNAGSDVRWVSNMTPITVGNVIVIGVDEMSCTAGRGYANTFGRTDLVSMALL